MSTQINDIDLLIDVTTGTLLRDNRSAITRPMPSLVQGDIYRLRVAAVKPVRSNPSKLWQYIALPSSLKAGVGPVGQGATAGTFTLTFGADTTAPLAYNATAAQVQTALNALASITTAGGVTVTASAAGGPWQIAFNTVGARDSITATPDNLFPLCQLQNYPLREGTASLTEIQLLVIERQPAALCTSWASFPAAAVTITTLQIGASGVPEIQRVAINDDTTEGTFTLTFGAATTASLAWNIAAEDLQAALEAISTIGTGNVLVTGAFPAWDVTFTGTLTGDQPAMTGNAAGLTVPIGQIGTLDLRTGGIEQLVTGEESITTTFEIEAQFGGTDPSTLLQIDVTVLNDGIPSSPGAPVALPTYLTETESDARYAQKTASSIADIPADANTAHTLNATFDHTEAEAALNALGTKVNALCTKVNDILTKLEAAALLSP